ncbi:MAG: aldose 1-epimerase [Leptospiraceae bacterium]|nr:aldose 1-epimerase [Leptospiraceae bacterium]
MFIAEHRKLRQPGTAVAPGEEELTSVYLAGPDESIEAEICPEIGCTCFSLRFRGQELLHFPFNLNHYRVSGDLAGIPLLYPWANRLEANHFPYRGKEYSLEGESIYRDGNGLPIHGLILKSSSWMLKDLNASRGFARALFEFALENDAGMRSNFPFNQGLFLTFELGDDGLNIMLDIENRDRSSFPISPGFHPYFSLGQFARDEIRLSIPAKRSLRLNELYLPDGESIDVAERWPDHRDLILGNHKFDTIFCDMEEPSLRLIRPDLTINVQLGSDFPVGIVYSPPDQGFVCLEPMTAPTNAFFLLDRGQWDVPVLEPGQRRSFEHKIEILPAPT